MDKAIQPELVILYTHNSPIHELKNIRYPFAQYIPVDKPLSNAVRIVNRLSRIIIKRSLIEPRIHADFAFPALDTHSLRNVKQLIFWKEDFQESYYPQYFNKDAFNFVEQFFTSLQSNAKNILVLSSFSSGNDLKEFYPAVKNKVNYLRFVSLLPVLDDQKLPRLLEKYNIDCPYFIVSNQFWPHKNHNLVLEAALKLKTLGESKFKILFTGKTSTTRNEEYFPSLQNYIRENKIGEQIIITGFLPRDEQLLLMKNSVAVIQPSLFEGWSTVIEDAKALNKYILATNLEVNREQVQTNISFFEKDNASKLAFLMQELLENKLVTQTIDYNNNIKEFRAELIDLFELQSN